MYSYNVVLKGIAAYIDNEIIAQINGWQKWVMGAGVGIALSNSTEFYNNLSQNSFVKMLNIINKNGDIDVDKIYAEIKKQAQKSSVTFNAPIVGMITLNEKDVDKIYEYIKESK